MIQITYQKKNGVIFTRIRNTYCSYRVGDITSMGWKVLDIKYKWGNKYYSYNEYDKLVDKAWKKDKKIYQVKQTIKELNNNLNRVLTFLILFKFFVLVSNKAFLEILVH